jgi:hypothetical protein
MTHRIDTIAPPGSLFKKPGAYSSKGEKKATDRQVDNKHLDAVRKLICVACGEDRERHIEAAHVRQASAAHGKRSTGMAMKPDDRWVLPLCRDCHARQHSVGELTFWDEIQLSPFLVCERLYAASPDIEAMLKVIVNARSLRRALVGTER